MCVFNEQNSALLLFITQVCEGTKSYQIGARCLLFSPGSLYKVKVIFLWPRYWASQAFPFLLFWALPPHPQPPDFLATQTFAFGCSVSSSLIWSQVCMGSASLLRSILHLLFLFPIGLNERKVMKVSFMGHSRSLIIFFPSLLSSPLAIL